MSTTTKCIRAVCAAGLLGGVCAWAQTPLPGWQNPDIGLTIDMVADAHNAPGVWQSPGLTLRGAELVASANIDPFASLTGNVVFSQQGAELHEAFALFPSLPFNVSLKGGLMLASFGRWNRFHTHAMPFTSEPRIYHEYANGMLALRGIELSWLAPLSHYFELTLCTYDLIDGHSHDRDPPDNAPNLTPGQVAARIGAVAHGGHYDYEGRHLYDIGELYALAGLPPPNDPRIWRGERRPAEFAFGTRGMTSFEPSPALSLDMGASLLYQQKWKYSLRTPSGFPPYYDKLLLGADLVLFWHPPARSKYRNLQTGIELMASRESFERLVPSAQVVDAFRTGVLVHLDYRHTPRWSGGGFASVFQANTLDAHRRLHAGCHATFTITHYQYLRIEYSRFNYPDVLEGVDRIMLQYDATIGHHTHGRQR